MTAGKSSRDGVKLLEQVKRACEYYTMIYEQCCCTRLYRRNGEGNSNDKEDETVSRGLAAFWQQWHILLQDPRSEASLLDPSRTVSERTGGPTILQP